MGKSFEIYGGVSKFPGKGGWYYVSVPEKFKKYLNEQGSAWGMHPIIVRVGNTSWKTKLMMKKGGNFFVALNYEARKKEKIVKGKKIRINFSLMQQWKNRK